MKSTPSADSFTIGRYLVTPLSVVTRNGNFASSVTIRSGQGTSTHARIFNFTAEFATRKKALNHASEQGVLWVNASNPR